MMTPLRNIIYEKVRNAGSITDVELINTLTKEGLEFTRAELNKVLLDLEILGLVRIGWVSKDKRRIEVRDVGEREARRRGGGDEEEGEGVAVDERREGAGYGDEEGEP
ncbi:MAG: hypothetical protein NZ888_04605 [Candidatus Nitrosocaldus sp.]|nr:hypothetical protein [Candidatus Nitrosocaldus sp.]